MSTGLDIAASALNAATTEIAVTSENIANAQTPGYATQRAQLAPQPGGDPLGIGDGVSVTSVAQVTNALLSANNLQAQGSLQSLTASQQVLTGIQDIFPLGQSSAAAASSSAGSSNSSIAGQLANFWSSWDAIAQDPSGAASRTQVVDQATGLAQSLNEGSTQLTQLATNTVGQLQGQVSQVNQLLTQAARLNGQIAATAGGGGSPNQLVDQLNQVVNQLGQLAGVSVHTQADGEATINIAGFAVVQGDQATALQLQTGTGTISPAQAAQLQIPAGTTYTTATVLTTNGSTPVPVTGGTIGGLLSGLGADGTIASYQGQLNAVAGDLASAVNGQLAQGYTAPGVSPPADYAANGGTLPTAGSNGGLQGSALPLFVAAGGGTITAGNIGVSSDLASNPALIAAASSAANSAGAGANDGSNAQAMAELANAATITMPAAAPGGSSTTITSPDVTYQQLIENIGSATQAVNSQVASQTSVANQAQQALQSATGVNQNTELTNLMQYQAAYQASAKLVSVIDAAVQSLLQAV